MKIENCLQIILIFGGDDQRNDVFLSTFMGIDVGDDPQILTLLSGFLETMCLLWRSSPGDKTMNNSFVSQKEAKKRAKQMKKASAHIMGRGFMCFRSLRLIRTEHPVW